MIAIDLCEVPEKTQKVSVEMTKGGCDEGHHEEAMMKVDTSVVGVFINKRPNMRIPRRTFELAVGLVGRGEFHGSVKHDSAQARPRPPFDTKPC